MSFQIPNWGMINIRNKKSLKNYVQRKVELTCDTEFLLVEPHQGAYFPICQGHWGLLTSQEGMKRPKFVPLQLQGALDTSNRNPQRLSDFKFEFVVCQKAPHAVQI
jgi:hypothetical protein